jgi:carbonic anhydrase
LAGLDRLREGNRRYVAGTARAVSAALRAELAGRSPHPFAVVVGCSDPRVVPELIFDTQVGECFVVRTAGNVVDDIVTGSVEYAVAHLGARLVVVLGHEGCGAVQAALSGGATSLALAAVLREIQPSVERSRRAWDPVSRCEDENIRHSIAKLHASAVLSALLHPAALVGAKYHLASGEVDFLI